MFSLIRKEVLSKCLILVLTACTGSPDGGVNKINYSENEVDQIKRCILILNNVFHAINENYGVNESNLGFIIENDSIYYRRCSDSKGNYINSTLCNYDTLLSEIDQTNLKQVISFLKEQSIVGSFFASSLQDHLLIVDTDYKSYGDNRFLMFLQSQDAVNLRIPYVILDRKEGLYLLKNKE
jgi:hypothetical protein